MTEPTNEIRPTPEDDEATTFIVALVSGLLGVLALITFAALKGLSYWAEGETLPLLTHSWWFLVAGVGLTVLGVGLQAHRLGDFIAQRRSIVALNVALMTVLAFLLTVLANYVGARHFKEFDWTRTGVYSISDESVQVVAHLEKPIRCWLVWPASDENGETVKRLLDHYRAHSDKFTFERADSTDPINFELTREKLGLSNLTWEDMAGVVVQSGYFDDKGEWKVEKSKHVSHRELFEQSFDGAHGASKKFKGEQAITNALIDVSEATKPKLYFLAGHEEAKTEGQNDQDPDEIGFVTKLLRQKNYDIAPLDIRKREHKDIPHDAKVIVVVAPKVKLDDGELSVLDDWLKKGGRLLCLLPPNLQPNAAGDKLVYVPTGLEPLLKKWNVDCQDQVIVSLERVGPYARPTEHALVSWFDEGNKITQPFSSTGAKAVFLAARPVKALAENHEAKATEIAKTYDLCYAVADPTTFMENPTETMKDKSQAFPVLVAVEQKVAEPAPAPSPADDKKKAEPKVTRIVVAGDSRWIGNPYADAPGYRNEPLLFNCISYLVGQERFTKEAAKESTYKLDMNPLQIMLYSTLSLIGLPLFAIMLGLSVWLIRRR